MGSRVDQVAEAAETAELTMHPPGESVVVLGTEAWALQRRDGRRVIVTANALGDAMQR